MKDLYGLVGRGFGHLGGMLLYCLATTLHHQATCGIWIRGLQRSSNPLTAVFYKAVLVYGRIRFTRSMNEPRREKWLDQLSYGVSVSSLC